MIDTSYVALEHPYRVIEYGGTVGLQIGVLVVTRETEGPDGGYGIETHSHPVVSYVNPQVSAEARRRPYFLLPDGDQTEGVVWDKVEASQVNTLGREGDELSWERLMDLSRRYWLSEPDAKQPFALLRLGNLWANLRGWGLVFSHLPVNAKGVMRLNVDLVQTETAQGMLCGGGSTLGLGVFFSSRSELLTRLRTQLEVFRLLITGMELAKRVEFKLKTKDKELLDVVVVLNAEAKLGRALKAPGKMFGPRRFVEKKATDIAENVG